MTDHTEDKIDRAVLVGLNAGCLSREENADESSLEELAAGSDEAAMEYMKRLREKKK